MITSGNNALKNECLPTYGHTYKLTDTPTHWHTPLHTDGHPYILTDRPTYWQTLYIYCILSWYHVYVHIYTSTYVYVSTWSVYVVYVQVVSQVLMSIWYMCNYIHLYGLYIRVTYLYMCLYTYCPYYIWTLHGTTELTYICIYVYTYDWYIYTSIYLYIHVHMSISM